MSINTNIVLFDLPTTAPERRSISPFTARIRFILNYRQLSYTTRWVELPDIEPTFKELGIPPTIVRNGSPQDGNQCYTVPAIIDSTDKSKPPVLLSDSLEIAKYLDVTYPDVERPIFPSLPLSGSAQAGKIAPAIHVLADTFIASSVYPSLRPLILKPIFDIQTGESEEAWISRVPGVSTPEDLVVVGKAREEKLEAVRNALDQIAAVFQHNSPSEDGWFLGAKPTYVDFLMLSLLLMIKTASPNDLWKEVKTWSDGKWERYVDAAQPYLVIQ